MEPIRPDSDEVAARKNDARKSAPRQSPPSQGAGSSGTVRPPEKKQADSKRGGLSGLMLLLLALIVLGGGWALFQQHQTIGILQSNIGEAEDWINRSKLSMARFEGRLSEADRELLESGSEITEKLAFLDSEMRKLWGVANDRNRKAIEANQKSAEFLEKKTDYLEKQRAEQRQLLTAQSEQLAAIKAKAHSLDQELAQIAELQQALSGTIAENAESAQALEAAHRELQAAQGELGKKLNTLGQRQMLSVDELRARLDAMEKKVAAAGGQSAINRLQGQLSSLKEVVDSVDASRSQITERLLQLERRFQAASGG